MVKQIPGVLLNLRADDSSRILDFSRSHDSMQKMSQMDKLKMKVQ
jgi:hypothetical protein